MERVKPGSDYAELLFSFAAATLDCGSRRVELVRYEYTFTYEYIMTRESELFSELRQLATEQRNPDSERIDTASVREILEIINSEDHLVPEAVRRELPYIEQATHLVVKGLRGGGRLIYAGAGTSGRLGILDASECPPTFGTPDGLVRGLIAGGLPAVLKSLEGAEDLGEN